MRKKVKGFEYEVSEMGEVRSLDRIRKTKNGKDLPIKGKQLKVQTMDNGYKKICLISPIGKRKPYLLHRLVFATHTGQDIDGAYDVGHKNDTPGDCRLSNLYSCNHSVNISDKKLAYKLYDT